MASYAIKYAVPFLQANQHFGEAVTAWFALEAIALTVRDDDDRCEDGNIAWAVLILLGCILAVYGAVFDLITDLSSRFRKDHVCLLAWEVGDDCWEPFPECWKYEPVISKDKRGNDQKLPGDKCKDGSIHYKEMGWYHFSSEMYRVVEVDKLEEEKQVGGYVADGQEKEGEKKKKKKRSKSSKKEEQKLLNDPDYDGGIEMAPAGDADDEDEKGDPEEPPPPEKVKVYENIGTSGCLPREVLGTFGTGAPCKVNGAILRSPRWLIYWALIRCICTAVVVTLLVFLSSILVFRGDCKYLRTLADPAYLMPAMAMFALFAVVKFRLPSLPHRDKGWTSSSMDEKCGWIWYPVYDLDQEMHDDVKDYQWQGIRDVDWKYQVLVIFIMIMSVGIPFLSFFILNAFPELWHDDDKDDEEMEEVVTTVMEMITTTVPMPTT